MTRDSQATAPKSPANAPHKGLLKPFAWLFTACAIVIATRPAAAAPPIRVMILDGESGGPYHKWPVVTQVLKKELEETGLFTVDVVTAPPAGGDFSSFHPSWSSYKVIVLNYDAPAERWPEPLKQSFVEYVQNGGGLVSVHASDNAFNGWAAYNEMLGVGGWRGRNESAGPHWFFQNGKLVSDNKPGPAGHHGLRKPFPLTVRAPQHPIMRGLPPIWMHQADELYDTLKGPGRNMTVLATGFSDPANSGTGLDEPLLMALRFGRGRIFHTALGHDVWALSSVDFIVTFQRGTEWAATGAVTQKVPANFPTANTIMYRADIAAMDPNYAKGMNLLDFALPARGLPADKPPTQ
jgi:type 1 glutamine amidotransferase